MVASIMRYADYWAQGNMGDSMGIFRPAIEHIHKGSWKYIVCGHSHVPGIVRIDDGVYVNTGSWTFASSHYCVWDGNDFTARDWLSGREFHQEFYEHMLDGSLYEIGFNQWWNSNYMGMLRYREGEERLGRLRGWESYIRDHQHLSYLVSRMPADPDTSAPPQSSEEVPK